MRQGLVVGKETDVSPELKERLAEVPTRVLLEEASRRQDLPQAADAIGGRAVLFEARRPEWHLALPDLVQEHAT